MAQPDDKANEPGKDAPAPQPPRTHGEIVRDVARAGEGVGVEQKPAGEVITSPPPTQTQSTTPAPAGPAPEDMPEMRFETVTPTAEQTVDTTHWPEPLRQLLRSMAGQGQRFHRGGKSYHVMAHLPDHKVLAYEVMDAPTDQEVE